MKAVSLAVLAVCMLIWAFAPQPDIRISDTGQVAFWDKPRDTLYVGRIRSDRFGREQFMQRAGKADAETRTYVDTLALCDSLACRFDLKGKTISVVSQPDVLEEECANSDLVVLTTRRAGPRLRRICEATLRDERDFFETVLRIFISRLNVRMGVRMGARTVWICGLRFPIPNQDAPDLGQEAGLSMRVKPGRIDRDRTAVFFPGLSIELVIFADKAD